MLGSPIHRALLLSAGPLAPRGQERKTTGSYYTHPTLVNQLLETALLPVMREFVVRASAP
ncbi:MAG: hypothetical protein U9R05_01440 [Chloroflexota bacterium]|nr:hypothetical protein [Chloroflexota bacterium]